MSDKSKIEWCDATWQVVSGCDEVSDGCRNCYSAALCHGRLKAQPRTAGLTRVTSTGRVTWTGEVRFHNDQLDKPMRWRKPRRIFVADRGDLFHDKVPAAFIDRVFAVMALCRQHTFILLTKRPERMRDYFDSAHRRVAPWAEKSPMLGPMPNVWLGVSVEDQATADARIPVLLDTPAAVRWVSAEPLLGAVSANYLNVFGDGGNWLSGERSVVIREGAPAGVNRFAGPSIDWVVVGGESGPNARPMHPAWPRDIRDACAGAGVPFFFKQHGEFIEVDGPRCRGIQHGDRTHDFWLTRGGKLHRLNERGRSFSIYHTSIIRRVGKKDAGRRLDGVEHNGMPA